MLILTVGLMAVNFPETIVLLFRGKTALIAGVIIYWIAHGS
jgi:hypothetical protein